MRLNKFLSRVGIASRRKADRLISDGKVRVNGVTADIGTTIDPEEDEISVDGEVVKEKKYLYLAFYKPRGCVTTLSDPHADVTLKDYIPDGLFPVGRLDKDAEGLLILTNDGDFAYNIAHPKFSVEKEYEVLTSRTPTPREMKMMVEGVESEGEIIRAVSVTRDDEAIKVVMTEGKKREIKRLFKAFEIRVRALKRVRIGKLYLGNLRPGMTEEIQPEIVGIDSINNQ